MLNYLNAKREALEAQRKEAPIVDEEIERAVEEYRARLYKERNDEITEQNKAIDAKLELLDELREEITKSIDDVVDELVDEEQPTETDI